MPNDGTGTGWDVTDPADGANLSDGAKQIRDLRIADALRANKEHVTAAAGTNPLLQTGGGEHKAGSAFAYIGNVAPTTRPDGTALTVADKGRIWINETVTPPLVYQYSGAAWIGITDNRTAEIYDTKAAGTNGGTSVASTWSLRTLNTLVDAANPIVTSLAANQFMLPAGTYHIQASCPAFNSDNHQCRIKNVTDTTFSYGTTEYSSNAAGGAGCMTRSVIDLIVTIAAPKVFQLEHAVRFAAVNNGFGIASDATWTAFSASGRAEVYSKVMIRKLY